MAETAPRLDQCSAALALAGAALWLLCSPGNHDNHALLARQPVRDDGFIWLRDTIAVADTQQMRLDGSNVDVDQEMAKLSLNSEYAQTMGQLLTNQYTLIKASIEEHF